MLPCYLSLPLILPLVMAPVHAELLAADEAVLKRAGLQTDGAALLAFFARRSLPEEERPRVQALIAQLGSDVYREREQAQAELVRRGPVVAEMLRAALKGDDLEIKRRAEKILARIVDKDVPLDAVPAAVRMLAQRRPQGAVEGLLAYLPFADNDAVADEVRGALGRLALENAKTSPALVAALADKLPLRRAAAGEALGKIADQRSQVRKLLEDPDATVRLRVALALARARDRDAIAVVIDSLPAVALEQAWQAEELLFRLAEGHTAPTLTMGKDETSRKKCRDAWAAWWKKHGDEVDLARLEEGPRVLGYTIVVLLDLGRIMELGPQNRVRWQIDNLIFPLDVQYLQGDRILIAEYHAGRVTERNTKGEILWEKQFPNAQMAQRLPNGNTFICSDSQVLEVDRHGKEVYSFATPGGERIMKAMKLANGDIACLTDGARIARFDTAGKELHSFPVPLTMRLFGGRIHMLPSGRVLVPHNLENKVVEYDARGKAIWEVTVEQPVTAVRLANGNTLVTSMLPGRGAVEFNRSGQEVWSYHTNTRVTRAIRR